MLRNLVLTLDYTDIHNLLKNCNKFFIMLTYVGLYIPFLIYEWMHKNRSFKADTRMNVKEKGDFITRHLKFLKTYFHCDKVNAKKQGNVNTWKLRSYILRLIRYATSIAAIQQSSYA